MDDRNLYETILGLQAPWFVQSVELDAANEEVVVRLELPGDVDLACTECGQVSPRYDRAEERRWRHLDTCQYRTVLAARIPRVKCSEHGVKQVQVSWAEDRSRFTALFEALSIRILRETSLSGMARIMRMSWHESEGIFRRAVHRGLDRRNVEPVAVLGVDEKSFQKRHEYVTVVADLERDRVLWVGDGRGKSTLETFYTTEFADRLKEVDTIVMDMWPPYIAATEKYVPGAQEKIVFDKFHIVAHLSDAVDKVRRKEHAELRGQGDDSLKGTKYLWLKGNTRRTPSERNNIEAFAQAGYKVGRAWAIKEAAMDLWSYLSVTWAKKFFRRWYFWATHSRLPSIIKAARLIKKHLQGVLNYLHRPFTNAMTEGLNAKIQGIKYRARGFRNRHNFRLAILFHCGKLNMDPR